MTDTLTLSDARDHVARTWTEHMQLRRMQGMTAMLTDWEQSTAADGALLLTARVGGPDRQVAMEAFANSVTVVLDGRGPRHAPHYDYSQPGRVVCVWRTGGVWVELWHPDTVSDVVASLEPVRTPSVAAEVKKPGGRLPFRRFRRSNTRFGQAS